jgi:glycosyltransferase involved in cell wall biosynthesis
MIILKPLVTVAIPTYNRPQLLRRALNCIAHQDYKDLQVIVSDNSTQGNQVDEVVASFNGRIDNLKLIKHPKNIGAINNFLSLIDLTKGKYFMWLADDDEITENYVSSLVDLLENDADASTATGNWISLNNDLKPQVINGLNYSERSRLIRVLHFIWKSDDAFIYGVHRTKALKNASFPGYWWPNKGQVWNWAYVFLMDMVLAGKIIKINDLSVQYIYHGYVPKQYIEERGGVIERIGYVIRLLNVQYLFLRKVAQSPKGLIYAIPAALVSAHVLGQKFCVLLTGSLFSRIRRFVCKEKTS